ncbi:MAG: DNA-binding domain-containing protein [Variovorax sp.]
MSAHASFQSAFAAALFGADEAADPGMQRLAAQPAFAVYRNTVMKGCIDALEANFPAVVRLVGRDWFRAAAALYAAAEPPQDGRLLHYGARFAAFLQDFAPAAELTYLPGVAQLDALWCDAHAASNAAPADAAWLAQRPAEQLGQLVLMPHPAARWIWFADQPVFTIWQRNRAGEDASAEEIPWQGEGALITRPADAVTWHPIGRAHCAFLDACNDRLPLAEAADRALAAEPGIDLAVLLECLLRAGAFTGDDLPLSTERSS